jgi:hypothetical protein
MDGRVVYAPTAEARGTPGNRPLRPYDTVVSQERRRLCHTHLGMIALTRLEFSRPAVTQVSSGACWFLFRKLRTDPQIKKTFAEKVGKYLYGMKYMSFGRISDSTPTHGDNQVWQQSLGALQVGRPLETVLNIHDGVGRLLLGVGDLEYPTYTLWRDRMRAEGEGEIINEKWRGRKKKQEGEFTPTTLPGNVAAGQLGASSLATLQRRNRGVDMYERIQPLPPPGGVQVRRETSGNVYYDQLDLRNELFGAGPSGTTGTTLAAGFAFGRFTLGSERMKEYLFAIIGYLVGGGMHSLHESLSILRLLGLEYNTGTLLGYDFSNSPARTDSEGLVRGQVTNKFPLLPQRFLDSTLFQEWRDEYYDVVVLGGTHWRFNNRG